ncbi:MAG: DNA repair protein RecO [Acholeplasmataceae bacterium]
MIEGMIYKTQAYKESARLLFTYTSQGKVTLIAEGAQKMNHPYRVLGQYLTMISFQESPKSMVTLKDAKLLNTYKKIKDDYDTLKYASLILEIIDHLVIEDMPHNIIFSHVKAALDIDDLKTASLSFSFKMLKIFGYELNLKPDGRKVLGVNIELGGLFYEGESHIMDLDVTQATQLLKLTRYPYDQLETLSESSYQVLKNFLLKYVQFHLQTTLKAIK